MIYTTVTSALQSMISLSPCDLAILHVVDYRYGLILTVFAASMVIGNTPDLHHVTVGKQLPDLRWSLVRLRHQPGLV